MAVSPSAFHNGYDAVPVTVSLCLRCADSTAFCVSGPKPPSTPAPIALWRTATAGPASPERRVAQCRVAPVSDTEICCPQAAQVTFSGSAAQVLRSTTPVSDRPCLPCQRLRARSVLGPKPPSGVVPIALCSVATAGPLDPLASVLQLAAGRAGGGLAGV